MLKELQAPARRQEELELERQKCEEKKAESEPERDMKFIEMLGQLISVVRPQHVFYPFTRTLSKWGELGLNLLSCTFHMGSTKWVKPSLDKWVEDKKHGAPRMTLEQRSDSHAPGCSE